jgi:methylmalonyl-CoA mutase N-terminal domain/subunit
MTGRKGEGEPRSQPNERDSHGADKTPARTALESPTDLEGSYETVSGIPIKNFYAPEDGLSPEYREKLGSPGEFPFTRGVQRTMYRGQLWTRRQVVGMGTAKETNARHKALLSLGQTGLSNDFDHPTLTGYDSDDPLARGEVGRIGVAIDTVQDMADLFEGIPIDQISTSFTINHPAPVILAMYIALGERRGIALENLNGTTQNDPLKEFYAQKTFVFPPRPSVRLAVDTLVYCARNMPKWKAMSIAGYQPRDAGCTADQEIAFAFAEAICYLERALGLGLDIDELAPQITFLFNVHNELFEEVAKFRAARRMWAHLMKDRFGAQRPQSCRLRMHVQTGGATLTAQQPENNIVRGTLQALAAVLGGTQSLAVSCYDEALSIPSEHAQMMSLRIQEIIAHESGVPSTVDPLGGSYYVESLTDELERRAWQWLNEIDGRGGMLDCVESGYIEQAIADQAFKFQEQVQSGQRVVVGVNDYVVPDEQLRIETFRVDRALETEQITRIREVKASRDQTAVDHALEDIRVAAASDGSMMPAILAAARISASEGEIIGALKQVFGEHRPAAIF